MKRKHTSSLRGDTSILPRIPRCILAPCWTHEMQHTAHIKSPSLSLIKLHIAASACIFSSCMCNTCTLKSCSGRRGNSWREGLWSWCKIGDDSRWGNHAAANQAGGGRVHLHLNKLQQGTLQGHVHTCTRACPQMWWENVFHQAGELNVG